MVARTFLYTVVAKVVVRILLCGCCGVLGGYQGIAIWLLRCLGGCLCVANVCCVVARAFTNGQLIGFFFLLAHKI